MLICFLIFEHFAYFSYSKHTANENTAKVVLHKADLDMTNNHSVYTVELCRLPF